MDPRPSTLDPQQKPALESGAMEFDMETIVEWSWVFIACLRHCPLQVTELWQEIVWSLSENFDNGNQKATSVKNHLQSFYCAIFFQLHITLGLLSRFTKISK